MNLENIKKAKLQVGENTPIIIIELLASQIGIAKEARARILVEGIVVRDMKGSVIKHPAIDIEIKALDAIQKIINNNKRVESTPSDSFEDDSVFSDDFPDLNNL